MGKIAGLLHCKKLIYRIAGKLIPRERKDVELVPLDSFHKDGGRSFPEGYWFEDFLTNLILVPLAERIKIIDDIVYYYRQNDKGIFFQSKNNVRVIDSFWVLKKLVEDREILGIEKTMEYYHVVLDKIRTCATLAMELGNKPLNIALFDRFCQLIKKQFQEYAGDGKYLPEMESALISGNFPRSCIACIFEQ